MALNVVQLDYATPPDHGPIFGVPIGTVEQAIDIFEWATQTPGYMCVITAKADGTQTIKLEGVTTTAVEATIGGDQWIVFNNGAFELFHTSTDALAVYKVLS